MPGVFDLQWDDPAQVRANSTFQIVGVNIYRSFDSEYGPFERITTLPVGSTFWRDQTDNVLVVDEDVSGQFVLQGAGKDAGGLYSARFVFRTLRAPVVIPGSQAIPTLNPDDVMVFVDGQRAKILSVNGHTGEVEIDPTDYANVATQSRDKPVVPGLGSVVTCSYRYNRSKLRTDLVTRVFYRVTTVGVPASVDWNQAQATDLAETPLEKAASTSSYEIEKLDWIWREGIRRNRFILTQGGERVKFFIRKSVGILCGCRQTPQYKQPLADCLECYGTGYVGGYDGPYDGLVAPDDAEKKITQQATGRTVEHSYEVWTGPTPLLSQRDFLIKINGERYSIGGVRMPSNRGMVLQQHFMIGHIDEKDIRYKVPLDNPEIRSIYSLQSQHPEDPSPAQITDKPNIPDERELRGRTIAWENITY